MNVLFDAATAVLMAPGNQGISLLIPTATLDNTFPQNAIPKDYCRATPAAARSHDYFRLSGTSMAAPVVSGAAALLLEKEPGLTPDQVKAILMKTAYRTFPRYSVATDPVTGIQFISQYDILTAGARYLDIGAAVAHTRTPAGMTGSALSPKAVLTYFGGAPSVSVVNTGLTAGWGRTAIGRSAAMVNSSTAVWDSSTQDSAESIAITIYGEN